MKTNHSNRSYFAEDRLSNVCSPHKAAEATSDTTARETSEKRGDSEVGDIIGAHVAYVLDGVRTRRDSVVEVRSMSGARHEGWWTVIVDGRELADFLPPRSREAAFFRALHDRLRPLVASVTVHGVRAA
jgi:hypothetical protein